jgi:hypothetical protein
VPRRNGTSYVQYAEGGLSDCADLKHVIEGKIKGMGRKVRKCQQLVDDLKENVGT